MFPESVSPIYSAYLLYLQSLFSASCSAHTQESSPSPYIFVLFSSHLSTDLVFFTGSATHIYSTNTPKVMQWKTRVQLSASPPDLL